MSEVWDEYMRLMLAKKGMKKEAQYDVGLHEDYLSPSVETMGVQNVGGGGPVGGGDAVYSTKPAPCQGGAEEFADPVVEGKKEIADAMLAAALSKPKGVHPGEEGLRASGKSYKKFTKEATGCMEMEMEDSEASEDVESFDLDELLKSLEPQSEEMEVLEVAPVEVKATSQKKVTLADLQELIEIADQCDAEGAFEEADEIDAHIRAKLIILQKTAKKN